MLDVNEHPVDVMINNTIIPYPVSIVFVTFVDNHQYLQYLSGLPDCMVFSIVLEWCSC